MASLQHGTTMVIPGPAYNVDRAVQAIAQEKLVKCFPCVTLHILFHVKWKLLKCQFSLIHSKYWLKNLLRQVLRLQAKKTFFYLHGEKLNKYLRYTLITKKPLYSI